MKRIGVMGLTLAVAFAISATAVTAASASTYQYGFKAAEYPAETKSTNGASIHGFEITGAVSLCEEAKFNTNEEKAPNPKGPQKTLEVHPTYSKCFLSLSAGAASAANVRTTGCNYVLTALEPGLKTGAISIKCEGTKKIEVESTVTSGCIITVGSQALKGIKYTNEAGKIKVSAEVEGIKYKTTAQCGIALEGSTAVYREGEIVLGIAKLKTAPAPATVLAEAVGLAAEVNFIYPHAYVEGALAGVTPVVTVNWGTINLKATEGSPTGAEATCHNVAAGTLFNPGGETTTSLTTGLNGIAAEGTAQAFATFLCEQTNICPATADHTTHVTAPFPEGTPLKPGLPWKTVLTEEVSGTIRAETTGIRVIFHCEKAGKQESEVVYVVGRVKGSTEKEKGQRPKEHLGTSALHPGYVELEGAITGELEVENSLGGIRADNVGAVKGLGYEAQELINASTP